MGQGVSGKHIGGGEVAQPEFVMPDFIKNNSAAEIHQRMMECLPDDIDDMPGGFPYDFTMPAALEKDGFINYHLVRALMAAFPQYAWDEWLDLHGEQMHIERHMPERAYGKVRVSGKAGIKIVKGTVFCTLATDTAPSVRFRSLEEKEIEDNGMALIPVEAADPGVGSNVASGTVILMEKPDKGVTGVSNPEPIGGGTERETDGDYYDRIAVGYENAFTFLGNDSDYIHWAKEAGAGDCIVIPAAEGPGTVKLILVDGNGQPANEKLVQDVHDHIVSPGDRKKRLLPTACAELICVSAMTVKVDFVITGLLYDGTTDMGQIKTLFAAAVRSTYSAAKKTGILRYNAVRPIISDIAGVLDFDGFLINGAMENIELGIEEYPETGSLEFS